MACLCHFLLLGDKLPSPQDQVCLFRIHQGDSRDCVGSGAFSGTLNSTVYAVTPVLSSFAFGRGEKGDLSGRE